MTASLLAEWDNFYVIIGSSAGGLTGLTFAVIALASDAKRVNLRGLRVYVTPTIVHFGAAGAAGLAYMAFIGANIGRISAAYIPVAEDWIWNVILPAIVYGTLLAIAFLIWRRSDPCLYAAAAASLVLLIIGIHNAWDIAVYNTVTKPGKPS
jgi:hypothetical protein